MFLSKNSAYAANPLEEADSIARQLQAKGKTVTKLNIGDPTKYFPTPKYIIDAYIDALKSGKTAYTGYGGLYELKDETAKRHMRISHAKGVGAEDVIITAGVSEALFFLNGSLIGQGDNVLLMNPYYSPYLPFVKTFGGNLVFGNYIESQDWRLDIDAMRKSLKKNNKKIKYLMIANPNNPTGTVMSKKDLSALVDVANEDDLMIVSDEIYDEIVYNGTKFTSMSEVAKGVPHIVLNGASKILSSSGFRIGFLIFPEKDRKSEQLKKRIFEYTTMRLSANTPAQYAVLEGIRNRPAHKKAVRTMVKEMERRTNFATKMINESEYMRVVKPNGAFYLLPRIEFGKLRFKNDKDFTDSLLKKECIQVTRGSGFGAKSHIRIVSLPTKEVLGNAISTIDKFCKANSR